MKYDCVDCKFCISDYSIFICTKKHKELDWYEIEEECEKFEKGVTFSNGYRLEMIERELRNLLEYTQHEKNTFLYHALQNILKRKFDDFNDE